MQETRDVEQTLATIRRLMERGRQYEAITARGALLAGLAALAASAGLWTWARHDHRAFLLTWLAVAAAAASWTLVAALRHSRRTGASWISAQARSVGLAVLPAYVVAAVLTVLLAPAHPWLLPPTWMLLHGTAVLATWYHAPPRLVRLGVAFLVVGAALAFVDLDPHVEMALGFGVLNLLHALVARRRPDAAD